MVDHAWACPTHAARRLLILFMKAIGRGVGPSDNHSIEFNFSPKGTYVEPGSSFRGLRPTSTLN